MGVQLFFVASAYTLCRSFEKRSNEKFPVTAFFIRRYCRIAPLYYLGIATYYFYYVWKHTADNVGVSFSSDPYHIGNVVANLLFFHGFIPAANNNIVPGGWSIGTEVAFYLIFPIVFKLSRVVGARHPERILALIAGGLAVNILAQSIFLRVTGMNIRDDNFVYYNIVNQFSVFEVGVFAYFAHEEMERKPLFPSRSSSIIGFLSFTLATMTLRHLKNDDYLMVVPLTAAWSFFFLLNILEARRRSINFLVAIGRVSYSMYIFHFLIVWGLLGLIFEKIGNNVPSQVLLLSGYLLAVLMSFGVALISERFVEQPGILFGRWIIDHLRIKFAEERLAVNGEL